MWRHQNRFCYLSLSQLKILNSLIQFNKIWYFQIPTAWNDVIMMSSLWFLCLYKNLSKTTYSFETLQADSLSKVLQNIQIWKPCDNKWRHNDVNGNNGKMRTSAEPNKIYIVWKVLMKAIKKCEVYWIWGTVSNRMETMTTQRTWSCHVTLATSFENFSFSPNSIFTFG